MYGDKVKSYQGSDLGAMAEWVGRKLVNHDPLQNRVTKHDTRPVSKRVDVMGAESEVPTVTYSAPNGKTYEVTLREIG
jgi:hypothetical protein